MRKRVFAAGLLAATVTAPAAWAQSASSTPQTLDISVDPSAPLAVAGASHGRHRFKPTKSRPGAKGPLVLVNGSGDIDLRQFADETGTGQRTVITFTLTSGTFDPANPITINDGPDPARVISYTFDPRQPGTLVVKDTNDDGGVYHYTLNGLTAPSRYHGVRHPGRRFKLDPAIINRGHGTP